MEPSKDVNIILVDCFGVVYDDKFKQFIENNEEKLKKYLNTEKNLQNKLKLLASSVKNKL